MNAATPKWAREFSDFPAADMPEIPAGFVDSSWGCEPCPRFRNDALSLWLSVNYSDTAQREFEEEDARFYLKYEGANPESNNFTGETEYLEFEEWPDVLAAIQPHILAKAFATVLGDWLTANQWAEMRAANVNHRDDGVCASHNYCDSNMAMAEAFKSVTGREPSASFETHYDADAGQHVADDPAEEAQCLADSALWNAAWDIAKPRYLTA
jgi:hypothetical protein